MTLRPALILAALSFATLPLSAAPAPPNSETVDFHGFTQHNFTVDGLDCRLVTPKKSAPGKPWIWRARFFGHEPQADIALLEAGYHVAFCDVANLFGNDEAIDRWNRFYQYATTTLGLAPKPALEGMSRGGLIIFNWASANPTKVSCIYGDAPVCTLLSWPIAYTPRNGKRNPATDACLKAYGHPTLESFQATPPKMPFDRLAPLAKHKIPVLLVVGLADEAVPYLDNGAILKERYQKLGAPIDVIEKPGVGHHPHSLKDPAPIVEFVKKHTL